MLKTAIILLTWKRISNLKGTLASLSRQTNKDFDIFISNANKQLLPSVIGAANRFNNLNITIYDHDNSMFTFRRLYVGKELALAGYDVVMFIDDDIYVTNNYVEKALSQYEPNSYKSCYAWRFTGNDYYNKRDRIKRTGETVHYCGTATSMFDAKLFLEDGIFEAREEAYKIEDLWLSYYAQHVLGWKLEYLDIPGVIIKGQDSAALFRQVAKEKYNKSHFLKDLIASGWDLSF